MAKTGFRERERAREYTELLLYVAQESGHFHEPVLSRAITTVMIPYFMILSVMVICTTTSQTLLDFPVVS
jgi:hypothetical protein